MEEVICFCGIGTALLDLLIPDDKFSKQMGFVISLVFVIGIITPLAEVINNFSKEYSSLETSTYQVKYENEEVYKQSLKKVTESNIEKSVRKMLEDSEIEVYKISVSVDISESSCISISRIDIDCSNFEKASEIIKNEVTKECEIWEG